MIADAEVSIRAAKLLTLHAASQFDRGLDYRHAACAAKLHAARMANAVVDDVLQIFGAMGYAKECAVERFYRDLRVARIFGGSDEMQRIAIQQDLFSGAVQIGDVF
jgi:acyl-CoA dehydrogenase